MAEGPENNAVPALTAHQRPARPDDATALAELANMAGEGLPYYLWSELADAGQSAWEIGRQRALREAGSFSWRNATVLEVDGSVAACLIGYPLDPDPEPVDYAAMPALFVPLQQLEDQAPGTWYLNVLATYPRFRGQGLGGRLLETAEQKAIESDSTGISLIVADSNTRAMHLYGRCGYRPVETRPAVTGRWDNPIRNWVLMIRSFAHRDPAVS